LHSLPSAFNLNTFIEVGRINIIVHTDVGAVLADRGQFRQRQIFRVALLRVYADTQCASPHRPVPCAPARRPVTPLAEDIECAKEGISRLNMASEKADRPDLQLGNPPLPPIPPRHPIIVNPPD